MNFKFAVLAVVCFAQAFALGPVNFLSGEEKCRKPSLEIPYRFEEAMHGMDEVRDTVSAAAMDAYARKTDFLVVLACFQQERENYVRIGQEMSERIQEASREIADTLRGIADEYAKYYEVPLRKIADTVRELPEKVYGYIQNKQFIKALEAMKEAREVVEENSKILGKITQDFVNEVPALADRIEELAREISEEARKSVDVINSAFKKCIEEGGPKRPEQISLDSQE